MSYYEYKYLVEPEKLKRVLGIFDGLYKDTDPYQGGWLESIYFDTLGQDCYHDCLGGNNLKTKFRTRKYLDTNMVQAQIKSKSLFQVRKWKISFSEAPNTQNSWRDMLETAEPSKSKIACEAVSTQYGPLIPMVRVKYFRRRYRVFDYRVNIDTNIVIDSHLNHPSIVQPNKVQLPFSVFEIKSHNDRPFLPFMGLVQLNQVAFSKFGIGFGLIKRNYDIINKYQ